MATVSFDKTFIVSDQQGIESFKRDGLSPTKVVAAERNYTESSARGVELLKQKLLSLDTKRAKKRDNTLDVSGKLRNVVVRATKKAKRT